MYLIGGPPGAGKTTLGLSVAGTLGVSSMTIDDLRTALLAATTPETHPEIHVIGLPDPWSYFTSTEPGVLIEHALAQHRALWPSIERVLRKKASNGTATVVDGWHLIPSLVHDAGLPDVCAVWIEVTPDVLETRERNMWDFFAKSDAPEKMLANFLARSNAWNTRMSSEARRLGFAVLNQDGTRSVSELTEEVINLR